MTLPRVAALFNYWQKCPPVHRAVAAYLGYGKDAAKPVTPAAKAAANDEHNNFLDALPLLTVRRAGS
jgi:hypothetical protein